MKFIIRNEKLNKQYVNLRRASGRRVTWRERVKAASEREDAAVFLRHFVEILIPMRRNEGVTQSTSSGGDGASSQQVRS